MKKYKCMSCSHRWETTDELDFPHCGVCGGQAEQIAQCCLGHDVVIYCGAGNCAICEEYLNLNDPPGAESGTVITCACGVPSTLTGKITGQLCTCGLWVGEGPPQAAESGAEPVECGGYIPQDCVDSETEPRGEISQCACGREVDTPNAKIASQLCTCGQWLGGSPPDKDTSKPQMSLIDGGFLAAQAVSLAAGIKNGRKRDDWRGLTWDEATRNQYIDALLRHVLLDFDPVAVANNCMIIWWKDEEAKKNG